MDLADLSLFSHLVGRPEAELDLARAALLIAEPEYPGLDVGQYIEKLDRLGEMAERQIATTRTRTPIATVVRFLYEDVGFRGNAGDYYDPRNSFLNEVLDRRTGIPITLALVLTEVCDRVGIVAKGVGFPGHFLVRVTDEDGDFVFLDPFDGTLLDDLRMAALYYRVTGESGPIDARLLEPATKTQMLMRLLGNLRSIYEKHNDRHRLLAVLARMQVLAPSEDVARQVNRIAGLRASDPQLN